jgi:hypothetical protein
MPAATAAALPPDDPPGVRDEVPRVARRAEAARLGRRLDAPLGQRRRADDDRAGLAEAAHEVRVERRAKSPMNDEANVSRLPAPACCS